MSKNIYTGFHAVEEKVKLYSVSKPKEISLKIFYSKPGPRIKKIISLAKDSNFEVSLVNEKELDSMVSSLPETARDHRGIILLVEGEKENSKNQIQLEQWITCCPENAVVIVLDSVTDPHNVGAILRSCDQFGASLMVVPDHRQINFPVFVCRLHKEELRPQQKHSGCQFFRKLEWKQFRHTVPAKAGQFRYLRFPL